MRARLFITSGGLYSNGSPGEMLESIAVQIYGKPVGRRNRLVMFVRISALV